MMKKAAFLVAVLTLIVGWALVAARPVHAASPIALTGRVSSAQEGLMEGVLVSAKADGATFTVTVVSDDKGRYAFPTTKLAPGHYTLKIRAVGYDLESPKAADVAAGAVTTADITLRQAKRLSAQLTVAEWMESMPGTAKQKWTLYDCVVCHSVDRIVRSTHNAEEFVAVIKRMAGYTNGSSPAHPQLKAPSRRSAGSDATVQAAAEWLASVNLSDRDTWDYALKTVPRPKGRATRVVITEYDLPRKDAQPHDVIVDSKGFAWYSDFGAQFLGRMDTKTGKVTEFPVPVLKPGSPTGALEAAFDKDENVWLALMYQGGIAKFDTKTEKFRMYPLPKEVQTDGTQESMVTPVSSHADGKVWTNNQADHTILRLDVKTGAWENLGAFVVPGTNREIRSYGIPADSNNNLYILEFSADDIGRIDAKTKQFKVYTTPTPASQPRRGGFDKQGRLWFAEFGVSKLGMLDPKTEKFREWTVPTPWSGPYQAVADKNGEVWSGEMMTDRVVRLDPKSGAMTEYLLPRQTNIRRAFVQNTTPVTFWVGSNHGASIVKVEPLD